MATSRNLQKFLDQTGLSTLWARILQELDKKTPKNDFNLLQNDPNYVHALMCNLLNRDRVMKYLQRGLQENPENPCGKYVGSIEKSENTYKKVFDSNIGRISHNSPEMVAERKTKRENEIRNIRENLIVENYDAKKALERAQELRRKLNEYEKDNGKER